MKRNPIKHLPWALAIACVPLIPLAQTEAAEEEAFEWATEAPAEEGAHRVEKGDTLWDISGRYLGDPFHWPRVWSYNPEIENPHWIFPGDRVRLGPTEVPVATEAEPVVEPEVYYPEVVPDVAVVGKIGYNKTGRRFRTDGIISRQALEASGRITNSFEEKALLAEGDRIYLDWPKKRELRQGETYVVFRPEGRIYHPVTDAFMGHFTRILGTVRITDVSPYRKHVIARIETSFEEIERGDRIGPSLSDFQRPVDERPNARNLVGRIAATMDDGLKEIGQDHIVFVDRGSAHGVEVGNRFQVVRAGDGLIRDDEERPSNLPSETIAELLVLEVHETTSAAMVVGSRMEFHVGDRVVMRAASR